MIQLRPYQQKAILDIRSEYQRGTRSVVHVLPTGGGKTALASAITSSAVARGSSVWFVVHREELLEQTSAEFSRWGIEHGIVMSGKPASPFASVQVCSIMTLIRRLDKLPAPDLIILDEAHHVGAKSWNRLFDMDCRFLGLTATPWRLDGKGLGSWFDRIVEGPSVKWLIENGYLSEYEAYAPAIPDTSGLHKRGGDYITAEIDALMNRRVITGSAISHYERLASGSQAIVFCCTLDHSKGVVSQFGEHRAAHLDGKTPKGERRQKIESFRNGDIKILSNVGLFDEGFDVPNVGCVICLRPTASLTKHRQMLGRGLRVGERDAIILDHAGNIPHHGLPDDDIEWSLEDREKRRKGGTDDTPPVRQCPECYRVVQSTISACVCGYEWKPDPRRLNTVEGNLERITESKRRGYVADNKLHEYAKSRGYSPGWAFHVKNARRKKHGS